MRSRRTIERRLFEAVALVLAGNGCQPPPSPVAPAPAPPAAVATPPPPVEVAREEVPPPPPPPPPRARAESDPVGFCHAYKRSSRVDAAKATNRGKSVRPPDINRWDAARGIVRCTITRETIATTAQIMYAPTCCPQVFPASGGCPPPSLTSVPATKVLVESAELGPDGAVLSSNLVWYEQVEQPPRHNCGRRPEGMALDGACAGADAGEELARMAELEAASVPAFERLVRELAHHGAPADLIARARAALRDEVRHARAMTEQAAARGAVPRRARAPRLPCRDLAAIARENVVEGCVREAFGALVATYQAERASPELRPVFRAIAADERRHCALAEDVHAWIADRLDAGARAELAGVRAHAERELRGDLDGRAYPDDVLTTLGLPDPAHATALFDAYFA